MIDPVVVFLSWMLPLYAIASVPVFLIFLDYHERSNIHKAVLFVVTFIAVCYSLSNVPTLALLWLAVLAPTLLFLYVKLARRR